MFSKIISIFSSLLLAITLMALASLSVWAYTLNMQLTQGNTNYQTLKTSNDKLQTDYNQLNSEYAKSQSDLQNSQTQIQHLQDELTKTQNENETLNAKVATLKNKISIIYAFEFDNEVNIGDRVSASSDTQLQKLWTSYEANKSHDSIQKLWDYMIRSMADTVGLNVLGSPSIDQAALVIISKA